LHHGFTGLQCHDVDFHTSITAGYLQHECVAPGAECRCTGRISHEYIPTLGTVAAVAILKGADGHPIDGDANDFVRPFLSVGVRHRKGVRHPHGTNIKRPLAMLPGTHVDGLPARSSRTLDDLSVTTSGL